MNPGFDLGRLYEEAGIRWLKPAEVLFILQNHERCHINEVPPDKPPSGSLFLFNRRVLRFFRRDGHAWRRKKDGRTGGEAHERLKVGNVDVLNCYYAHGEQNPSFQRRSYWILDPAYEHIVLVHYRELDEERYIPRPFPSLSTNSSVLNRHSSFSNIQDQRSSELNGPYQTSFSPGSVEEVSSKSVVGNNKIDQLDMNDISGNHCSFYQPQISRALRELAAELNVYDDDDDDDYDDNTIPVEEELAPYPSQGELRGSGLTDYERENLKQDPHTLGCKEHGHYSDGEAGKLDNLKRTMLFQNSGGNQQQIFQPLGSEYIVETKGSPSWKEMLEMSSSSRVIDAQDRTLKTPDAAGFPESSAGRAFATASMQNIPAKDVIPYENDMPPSSSEGRNISLTLSSNAPPEKLIHQDYRNNEENHITTPQVSEVNSQLQLSDFFLVSDSLESPLSAPLLQEAKEPLHNISRPDRCDGNSIMGTINKESSIDWMGNMHIAVDNNTYSTNYSGMFDQSQFVTPLGGDLSLTVAQKQRFRIREISPEWAFSSESTKIIITGDFLCNPSECAWAAMFGDVEVHLEIIQEGVLRCQAPPHAAGMVTLCITSGNRESCSEVREFEYRLKPEVSNPEIRLQQAAVVKSSEELLLLAKFVQMLLCGCDHASVQKVENAELETDPSRKLERANDQWDQVIESLSVGHENPFSIIEWLLQELLKDKLQQWLSSKNHANEEADCFLSKPEQGIIHMISGLGYDWALNPILYCGVGVDFRDLNGWTSLHWAARFGREKMVAALLAAGASAGAVTDPTPQDPIGKSPAYISDTYGYKGLAGYLSEVALTSHRSSLTLEEIEISKGSAELEAESAVKSISQSSIRMHAGVTEDQLSLKDSLAAVRNATQAAARIQSAFRSHSFRKKQLKAAASRDEYGMTPEEIHGISAASKFLHGHSDQKFYTAALRIQRKYHGWKGRKNFLTLRQHVVKLQAHVRGHQARKKYREFLWTVSVLEKVILRWRRGGVGLRGFRAELEPIDDVEDDDILKIFRKLKVDAAVDDAVSRVLSMAQSPGARQQYSRMLECYRRAKAKLVNASATASNVPGDSGNGENSDVDMYQYILDDAWAHVCSPSVNLRKL